MRRHGAVVADGQHPDGGPHRLPGAPGPHRDPEQVDDVHQGQCRAGRPAGAVDVQVDGPSPMASRVIRSAAIWLRRASSRGPVEEHHPAIEEVRLHPQ